MKKLLSLILFTLFLVATTSCSQEESNDGFGLKGSWTLTGWTVKTPMDLNNDGVGTSSFSPGCLGGSNIEFLGLGKGELFFFSDVVYNTTPEEGGLFIMYSCQTSSERSPLAITYEESDMGWIVYNGSEEYNLTMDGNTLYMVVHDGLIATDLDSGEITISQDVTYVFTKN